MGCETSIIQNFELLPLEGVNICSLSQVHRMPYEKFYNQIQKVKKLCGDNNLHEASKLGDKFFSKHYLLEAIEIYEIIIEKDPKFGLQNFQGLGNTQMALSYYLENVWQYYDKLNQDRKSVYDSLSLCYMILAFDSRQYSNQLGKGIEWYKMMVQKQPNSTGLLIGYGNLLFNHDKCDAAIQIYDKATKVYEDFVIIHVIKAFVYQFKKLQKQKSIQAAEKALKLSNNNQYAQLIIAINIQPLDERIQKLQQLQKKYPNYVRITNEMGADYLDFKKDDKKAKQCFQKTVIVHPLYYKGYANIGFCCRNLEDYPNALKFNFKSIQINKLFEQSFKGLMLTFEKLNYTDEDINKELENYPNVKKDRFWIRYGEISETNPDKLDKAISYYKKSIQINPSFALAYEHLAETYKKKKMKKQAMDSYKKAIELRPDNYFVYFSLAMFQVEEEYEEDAIKMYQKAIQLNPRHMNSYNNLGNIYYKRKNYERAEQYYQNAIKYDSKNSLILATLGICYMSAKKYKEAFQVFTETKNNLERTRQIWGDKRMQFTQQTLKKVDIGSDKWNIYLKSGSISDDQRNKLHGLMSQFSNKLKIHQKIDPNIKMPLERVMHHSMLQITKIIYENKFRLSGMKEVFTHVMTLYCDVDEDYFHIIPLYIVQFFLLCVYELKIFVEQAEQSCQNMMKQLAQMVRNKQKQVNESKNDQNKIQETDKPTNIQIQLTECKPLNKQINLFKDAAYFNNYQDLYAQIDKVNNAAKPSFNDFNLLVQEVRTKGNGIPGGISMKIPTKSEDQFKVIMRIMQKMFKKQINPERINKIIRNIQAKIVHSNYANMNQIVSEIVDSWNNQITKILKQRRQTNVETQCFLSDLIRAKCTFNTIQDLLNAVKVADSYCKSKGYQIVQVDNRLNKVQTKDVVLKIKIRDAVCQFQLAMPQSAKLFHLDHSVYEIIRSPLGCIFGSYLYISKSVKYPLVKNSQDMFEELSKSKDMMDKINRMYPQYVMNALTKDWKMNKG